MAPSKNEINSLMMEEFRQGMSEFNAAMQKREDFALRIAKRTTQIIRFSILGLFILGLAMFFLISTLISNMSNITGHMADISEDIKSMRGDFRIVGKELGSMSNDVTLMRSDMGTLTNSVSLIQPDISKLNNSVVDMSGNITTIRKILAQTDKSIHHMGVNVTGLNQSVGNLVLSVGVMSKNINLMTRDINDMAAPMRMVPFSSRNRR